MKVDILGSIRKRFDSLGEQYQLVKTIIIASILVLVLLALFGCATPETKARQEAADTELRTATTEAAPEMVDHTRGVVMCGLDPTTFKPIEGANCAGMYVKMEADADTVAGIIKALRPPERESAARTVRELGGKIIDGLTSPQAAMAAVAATALAQNKNRVNTTATDNSINSSYNEASASSSTVGDISEVGSSRVTDSLNDQSTRNSNNDNSVETDSSDNSDNSDNSQSDTCSDCAPGF